MKALELIDLNKSFGGGSVLSHIHLSVDEGERRAVIGPNGAGKTTLFNVVSGLLKPDSGRIALFEKDITKMAAFRRARLGMARTFQRNNLFLNLCLQDNVRLALREKKQDVLEELLQKFGFHGKMDKRLAELSYGEQRQVEILLALAQAPRLLLLDEPTAGMSPVESEAMTEMIASLPRDITVLLIEHDMNVVFHIADKVTVLHHGEILSDGDKVMIRGDSRVQEVYLGMADGEE